MTFECPPLQTCVETWLGLFDETCGSSGQGRKYRVLRRDHRGYVCQDGRAPFPRTLGVSLTLGVTRTLGFSPTLGLTRTLGVCCGERTEATCARIADRPLPAAPSRHTTCIRGKRQVQRQQNTWRFILPCTKQTPRGGLHRSVWVPGSIQRYRRVTQPASRGRVSAPSRKMEQAPRRSKRASEDALRMFPSPSPAGCFSGYFWGEFQRQMASARPAVTHLTLL